MQRFSILYLQKLSIYKHSYFECIVLYCSYDIFEEDLWCQGVAMINYGLSIGPIPAIQLHTPTSFCKSPGYKAEVQRVNSSSPNFNMLRGSTIYSSLHAPWQANISTFTYCYLKNTFKWKDLQMHSNRNHLKKGKFIKAVKCNNVGKLL